MIFSYHAHADSFGLPSINSLPILYDMLGDQPKYHEALNKTQEACFKQVGLTQQIDAISSYATTKVTNTVITFTETQTPFNAAKMGAVGYAVYSVGVKKQITQRFRNPWFHKVMHVVTLNERGGSVGVSIPF